jgi:hypothetical protein
VSVELPVPYVSVELPVPYVSVEPPVVDEPVLTV